MSASTTYETPTIGTYVKSQSNQQLVARNIPDQRQITWKVAGTESSEVVWTSAPEKFEQRLRGLLTEESVEDGYSHPAELLLDETLTTTTKSALWIQNLFIENHNNPLIATGLLQCIGRLRRDLVEPWGRIMARTGLAESSIAIREAAVIALEAWGDKESLEILKEHEESTPWLARYIQQVIEDLSR